MQGSKAAALAAALLLLGGLLGARAQPGLGCAERLELSTHGDSRSRVALSVPDGRPAAALLVLLVGGGGFVDLDEGGCPRRLLGNSLLRLRPLWLVDGFATAIVDAPSDWQGDEGLAGFRASDAHADDLGRVIALLRRRLGLPVWLIGTSRGTISAVHAAARLAGEAAPDGLVLSSLLGAGHPGGRLAWVAQTVFDARLEAIRQPLLVIAHADDSCPRSPPALMQALLARTEGVREQLVLLRGGSASAKSGLEACEGRSPHGFYGQEQELAAGIARFVRGGSY